MNDFLEDLKYLTTVAGGVAVFITLVILFVVLMLLMLAILVFGLFMVAVAILG